MEIKILCLSFWTPPTVRPQSILINKMIREWKRRGLEPVIMTYDVCGDWKIDLPVYKIPQFYVDRFLAHIPGMVLVYEFFYYRRLFKIAKKIIKKHGINIMFSFANPQASNILGAMISNKLGVKFISHFSDPWVDNIYKKYAGLSGIKAKLLERYVVKNSDKIIFITEAAKKLVMEKYPSEWLTKAAVIPHCFDPKDYPESVKNNLKFTISYIGAFYKQRNPELLLEVLGNVNKNPEYAGKFRIKLVGCVNKYAGYNLANLKNIISKNGLTGVVDLISVVEYKKSLEYMKLADCLVVIDADMENSPFLTSKVVDYAGSGNIIVGITPSGSPTADFLKKLGFVSFNYSQIDELAEYFEKLINKKTEPKTNQEFLENYQVKNTTDKLFKLFEEIE